MPRTRWYTHTQKEYLENMLLLYLEAKTDGPEKTRRFFIELAHTWLTVWPLEDADRRLQGNQAALDRATVQLKLIMPAIEWAAPAQKEYLVGMLSQYREVHAAKKTALVTRFFVGLDSGWFTRFPAEAELGITPAVPGGPPLSDDDVEAIRKATVNTKARLRAWMRYRAKEKGTPAGTVTKNSSLFKAIQVQKPTRQYRAIEVYQKLYRAKIRALMDTRGYARLNEEAEAERVADEDDLTILTPDEAAQRELAAVERIKAHRAARMSLLRNAAMELFAAESDEVLAEVEAAKDELNAGRVSEDDGLGDTERTPEQYQHSIDQLGAVLQLVAAAIEAEAGWKGLFLVGGPNPKRIGAVTMKTFSFGATPLGIDFAASYPDFADLKSGFAAFLKQAFPHEVRDQRALVSPDAPPNLEGMIRLESSPEPAETTTNTPTPTATKVTSSAPKRMRHKKVVQAPVVPAPAPPPTAPAPPATENAVVPPSTPTTPETPTLTLPEDFDNTMNDILSDYGGSDFFLTNADTDVYVSGWNGTGASHSMDDTPPMPEPVQIARPGPRAIHRGAQFEPDRQVGGSPGRWSTFDVGEYRFPANDYPFPANARLPSNCLSRPTSFPPPSPLIQAFTPKATFATSAPLGTPLEGPINSVANPTRDGSPGGGRHGEEREEWKGGGGYIRSPLGIMRPAARSECVPTPTEQPGQEAKDPIPNTCKPCAAPDMGTAGQNIAQERSGRLPKKAGRDSTATRRPLARGQRAHRRVPDLLPKTICLWAMYRGAFLARGHDTSWRYSPEKDVMWRGPT
ncbi:hypothetical protein K438DRAFT_1768853 [Mycena galopus ATCC 62051]|nr:hypothetical protein K438DRAFT_1768853 [Mycena galopus ATCC 62051]